jgi:hypothetical protein
MGSMLPPPPSITALRDAGVHPDELITWKPTDLVWRVHRTTGGHVMPWNGMRTFGPILRFDHHPLPRAEHLTYGIWYGASSPRGALAEAFQSARVIDRRHGDPYLAGLRFQRPLRLFEVSASGSSWETRDHDELDGIIFRGRLAGGVCVALLDRAADAFPARPELSLSLAHPALDGPIATVGNQLGYIIT